MTNRDPYIKGMTDAELADYIPTLQSMLYNASEIGGMNIAMGNRRQANAASRQVFRLTRLLDIAVNVKRQRIIAGEWTA